MDLATVIGLGLGFGAIIIAVILEGGDLGGFINLPAGILVIGGTFGATMICFSLKDMLGLAGVVKNAFFSKRHEPAEHIRLLSGLAERARREGLLVLEQEIQRAEDPFLRKGLQLAVDGVDPQMVRTILETEVEHLAARHKVGESILSTMGGFSPTLGIIGTVMGLVHMLHNLSEPGTMGPAIAGAFIATLYGVGFANLVFLPLGNKLKAKSEEEVTARMMIVEGILAIQSGDNPRVVEEKLGAFLSPKVRATLQTAEGRR